MSSNEVVIDVNNISKCFEIYNKPSDRLKQFVSSGMGLDRKYYKEYWALNNISFQVQRGETVGILGGNGAGKSTLLQIICNTLTPTSGNISVQGRIAALLELGSGFNPEFTGIENIYMSCALLGLSKSEIDDKLDKILSFADIGDFVNQPVKTYSSGMFVRLAFAVNVQSSPEIMIVDEALAVGDMNFQAKCMTALKRIKDDGASILFVSHDTSSVKSLCERAVLLEKGELLETGTAGNVTEYYIKRMRLLANQLEEQPSLEKTTTSFSGLQSTQEKISRFKGYGEGGVEIVKVGMFCENGVEKQHFDFNEKIKIRIRLKSAIDETVAVAYYIHDEKKNIILGAGPKQANQEFTYIEDGKEYEFIFETRLPIKDGNYSLQVQVNKPLMLGKAARYLQVIDDAIVFKMEENLSFKVWSQVYIENRLSVKHVK